MDVKARSLEEYHIIGTHRILLTRKQSARLVAILGEINPFGAPEFSVLNFADPGGLDSVRSQALRVKAEGIEVKSSHGTV